MGIRGRFVLVTVLIALAVGGSSYFILESSHHESMELSAVRIADIVSSQVVADRAEYTANVVGKLKADGAGASRESANAPGYVQLPAQFVRNVSKRVEAQAAGLYSYSLVSLWNLNSDQGLNDDFDRWAWGELSQQDEEFRSAGIAPGAKGYSWQSVYRFETANGAPVLRYMRADPAAAESCVSCHNQYEQTPEIAAMRKEQGVTAGKSWNLHGLMGAIRVEVPVNEVAAAAAHARNVMLAGLGGVFAGGFALLFGLIQRTVIRPVEKSVREVEGFTKNVDLVIGCNKDLVVSADAQERACSKVLSSLETGDQGVQEVTSSIRSLADAASDNAMKAEESAVFCNDLDQSFGGLKGRLQEMLSG